MPCFPSLIPMDSLRLHGANLSAILADLDTWAGCFHPRNKSRHSSTCFHRARSAQSKLHQGGAACWVLQPLRAVTCCCDVSGDH